MLDAIADSGPACFGERLTRRPPSQNLYVELPHQRGDLFDPIYLAEVPVHRQAREVVLVGLHCFFVVVGAQDDLHARLLQAQTQSPGAREEIRC